MTVDISKTNVMKTYMADEKTVVYQACQLGYTEVFLNDHEIAFCVPFSGKGAVMSRYYLYNGLN